MAFLSLRSLPKSSSALQSRDAGSSVQQPCRVLDCPRKSRFPRRLEALCPPHKAPGITRRCLATQSNWQPDYQASEPEGQSSRYQKAGDGLLDLTDSGGQHVVNQSQWQEEHRDQYNDTAADLHKHDPLAGSQAAGFQTSSSNASCSNSSTEQPVGNDDIASATSQQKEDPSLLMLGQAAESTNVIPPQKRSPPRRPIPISSPSFSQQNQTRVDGGSSSSSSSSMDPQRTLPNHDASGSSNLPSREDTAQASAALAATDSTQSAAQHQQPAYSSSSSIAPLAGKHNSVAASSQQTEWPGRPMPSQAADSDNVLPATCSGSNSNVQQQMPASNTPGGSSTPDSMMEGRVSPTPQVLPTLLMRSSRLVELMQRVSEDKLTDFRKKDLGPVPSSNKQGLPPGAEIHTFTCNDGTGSERSKQMLVCRHGLPVIRKTVYKAGLNNGRVFYRCALPRKVSRSCFYAFETERFTTFRDDEQEAAKQSAAMWEMYNRERLYWDQKRAALLRNKLNFQFEEEWDHKQGVGAWGESYLYLWLKEVLPHFGKDNWVSSNRRFVRFPDGRDWRDIDDAEPAFDFHYKDVEGVLGVKGAAYFIDAKAIRGVAVYGETRERHKVFLTAREWDLAQELHQKHGTQGSKAYVVIVLDRVDSAHHEWGGPRLAAVMFDPYGMATDLQIRKQMGPTNEISVKPNEFKGGMLLWEYPVLPEVLTTASVNKTPIP